MTTERVDLTALVVVGGPICEGPALQSPRSNEMVIVVESVEQLAVICEFFGRRDGFAVWRIQPGRSDPVEVECA